MDSPVYSGFVSLSKRMLTYSEVLLHGDGLAHLQWIYLTLCTVQLLRYSYITICYEKGEHKFREFLFHLIFRKQK